MSLKGKVALVTGAWGNVGRAIALALAQEGVDLVLNTRSALGGEKLDKTAQEARHLGVRAIPVVADVGVRDQVRAMVQGAETELGRIDIMVNNAVQRLDSSFLEVPLEGWEAVLRTNLTGPMLCCQAVLAGMISRRWGRIINFSGFNAWVGAPEKTAIATVKMGIVGFTRSLASEFGRYGITVNVINPGAIDTDRIRSLGPEANRKQVERTPVGRLGRPEEIAATCLFLCSEGAAYINGQTISVNGGSYMH